MIKNIVRINTTNKCNLSCGSCYIQANPHNEGFLKFSVLQSILCKHRVVPVDVVLEGGEPFLHPQLFLFLEYINTVDSVKKAIISTNGTLLDEYYDSLLDISNRLNLRIQLNVAITSHILVSHAGHMEMCRRLLRDDKILVSFDVTYTSEEDKDYLTEEIHSHNIPLRYCSFSPLRAYGALRGTEYPQLPYDDDNWHCYASDGSFFGNDVEARADYELSLRMEDPTPIFDVLHHKDMWINTEVFLADISFENQDNIEYSVKDFQRAYIERNTPSLSMYNSYVAAYIVQTNQSPVTEEHPYEVEREVVDELTSLMQRTPDMKRFYVYKDMALKLCHKIAYFKPKACVRTNSEDYCKC